MLLLQLLCHPQGALPRGVCCRAGCLMIWTAMGMACWTAVSGLLLCRWVGASSHLRLALSLHVSVAQEDWLMQAKHEFSIFQASVEVCSLLSG